MLGYVGGMCGILGYAEIYMGPLGCIVVCLGMLAYVGIYWRYVRVCWRILEVC